MLQILNNQNKYDYQRANSFMKFRIPNPPAKMPIPQTVTVDGKSVINCSHPLAVEMMVNQQRRRKLAIHELVTET